MKKHRDTLSTESKSWIEVKTIKGKRYRYKRFRVYNGGGMITRSVYMGKA